MSKDLEGSCCGLHEALYRYLDVHTAENHENHQPLQQVSMSILEMGLNFIYTGSKNSVHTSRETHYVSATKSNRLMLFREIIAVYCENHMEHINTLCGQNAVYINSVRASQETHYVSATKSNRLMLFREIIAVYCENHMAHINTLCGQNAEFSSYLSGNTLRLHYKVQLVNAV
jgi:hypothetical protein